MDRERAEPRVDSFPGERARRWVDHHAAVAAPATHLYEFVWDLSGPAAGPFCTDVDGNVLLDFTSHVASAPLGYDDPDFLDRLGEFDLVDPVKFAGQDFYAAGGWPPEDPAVPGPTQLMDRLTDLGADYGLDRVFLVNSGAEANENALKICYDHTGGQYGFTFEGAFHGRTLGTLSLNRSKAVHRRGFPELAGVDDAPFCTDPGCGPASCECGFFAAGTDALERHLAPAGSTDPGSVAYVILEPVQGEGGVRVPSDDFMAAVGDVCERHGIPLIADEVQTGLGRTGETWAVDHFDLEPDVITSAKALRVGATLASADVFPDRQGRLSSTWGAGDLVGSLAGALTIDAIEERDLATSAAAKGQRLRAGLDAADPPHVTDVRGLGLMVAVEFDTPARRDAAMEACLERGLLTLGGGRRALRLLPPLTVTDREVDLGVELLADAAADPSVGRA